MYTYFLFLVNDVAVLHGIIHFLLFTQKWGFLLRNVYRIKTREISYSLKTSLFFAACGGDFVFPSTVQYKWLEEFNGVSTRYFNIYYFQ